MASFIIYDQSTGAIRGSYTVSKSVAIASSMKANTPAGMSALAVDANHPVILDQKDWQVVNGVVTAIVPTDAQLLAVAQSSQLAILTAAYNTAKAANVAYLNTSFMAGPDSQEMFAHAMTAYTAVGATPSGFFVVDASYNEVPMTLDQLKGLTEAISTQVWAVFQRWVAVKQALAAAMTVAAVQAVVW